MNSRSLVFDKDAVLERVDGDIELLLSLIEILESDLTEKLPAIRASLDSGDAKAVSETAHSLKSALGNLGAMVAHGAALALERSAKDGDLVQANMDLATLQDAAVEFLAEFHRVMDPAVSG